jgi:hypothetical protein
MKLTIMLLTVSFAFLLTTLPMGISLIIRIFWQRSDHEVKAILQFKLAKTIAELLMYVNHSMNFVLYCATGQKFRQQIVYLLRCKRDNYAAWSSLHTDDTANANNAVANANGININGVHVNVGGGGGGGGGGAGGGGGGANVSHTQNTKLTSSLRNGHTSVRLLAPNVVPELNNLIVGDPVDAPPAAVTDL